MRDFGAYWPSRQAGPKSSWSPSTLRTPCARLAALTLPPLRACLHAHSPVLARHPAHACAYVHMQTMRASHCCTLHTPRRALCLPLLQGPPRASPFLFFTCMHTQSTQRMNKHRCAQTNKRTYKHTQRQTKIHMHNQAHTSIHRQQKHTNTRSHMQTCTQAFAPLQL